MSIDLIFSLLLIITFVILLYQALFILGFANYYPAKAAKSYSVPVSVIVAARNEAENLENLVRKLISQNYFEFEVIVVNDRSSDNTQEVLKALDGEFQNLNIVDIKEKPDGFNGKKFAITMGIKAAKYDLLLDQ